MKINQYLFTFASFLLASQAHAQVYKCTFVDVQARQNKVIYSDMPCQPAHKQTLTAIQTQVSLNQQMASANAINLGVTRAVLNQNFKLARSLASTKEHWRLIAIAEGEAAPVLAVANNPPVPLFAASAAQVECSQAKDDFEYISRVSWRDKELVATKKSMMYASCGVLATEPAQVQNRPIFIGHSYNGFNGSSISSGRLIYPNALPYALPFQHRPYGGISHHAYPQHGAHHTQHHGQHLGQQQASGVSLHYQSKHFGIHVNN